MMNPESRFLQEIPQDLIEWRRTDPTPGRIATGAGSYGGGYRQDARGGGSGSVPSIPSANKRTRALLVLEPGDRVTHDKYGLGRVVEVTGAGEAATSLIDFGAGGRVKLMHNFAPVQKL